jgi:hypothetical protein
MVTIQVFKEKRRKEKEKEKKKEENAGKKRPGWAFPVGSKKSPVLGDVWSVKIDYLVSHSGRTLLPQTQGRGHVSQHLIHVRVRHPAPGSTKTQKRGWGREQRTKGRAVGGRGRWGRNRRRIKKKYEPRK